jgi:hypothetical protein
MFRKPPREVIKKYSLFFVPNQDGARHFLLFIPVEVQKQEEKQVKVKNEID